MRGDLRRGVGGRAVETATVPLVALLSLVPGDRGNKGGDNGGDCNVLLLGVSFVTFVFVGGRIIMDGRMGVNVGPVKWLLQHAINPSIHFEGSNGYAGNLQQKYKLLLRILWHEVAYATNDHR